MQFTNVENLEFIYHGWIVKNKQKKINKARHMKFKYKKYAEYFVIHGESKEYNDTLLKYLKKSTRQEKQ